MSSLSQIWTLKSKSGISEENFRALIFGISGQESTKSLSHTQIKKLPMQRVPFFFKHGVVEIKKKPDGSWMEKNGMSFQRRL